ncbi:MAG: hypothetical protein M3444_00205 [Acidobacteriota bacterium]|nr:hypothetical protein [Acidobacteriota bacterium]MDQ5835636.1 hypothetical protein [Acidobacteriota bacterium]
MLLMVPIIIVALAAGSYLLALASDGFAYELSRVVEAAFDALEYRLALLRKGRAARETKRAGGQAVAARAGLTC